MDLSVYLLAQGTRRGDQHPGVLVNGRLFYFYFDFIFFCGGGVVNLMVWVCVTWLRLTHLDSIELVWGLFLPLFYHFFRFFFFLSDYFFFFLCLYVFPHKYLSALCFLIFSFYCFDLIFFPFFIPNHFLLQLFTHVSPFSNDHALSLSPSLPLFSSLFLSLLTATIICQRLHTTLHSTPHSTPLPSTHTHLVLLLSRRCHLWSTRPPDLCRACRPRGSCGGGGSVNTVRIGGWYMSFTGKRTIYALRGW